MKMFVVLALSALVAAEPEADASLFYSGYPTGYPTSYPAGYPTSYTAGYPWTGIQRSHSMYRMFNNNNMYNNVNMYNRNNMAYPTPSMVYNNNHNQHHQYNTMTTVEHPMSATHTITSYNSPLQYTAVSNGVVPPKYIAKNYNVEHVVAKREAEADSDAFFYNTVANHNSFYNPTAAYPMTSYSSRFPSTYPTYPMTTYSTNLPMNYPSYPTIARGYDHSVAFNTYGSMTHSANVGFCTNFRGEQVPC